MGKEMQGWWYMLARMEYLRTACWLAGFFKLRSATLRYVPANASLTESGAQRSSSHSQPVISCGRLRFSRSYIRLLRLRGRIGGLGLRRVIRWLIYRGRLGCMILREWWWYELVDLGS